jgi:hypothetical protein
MRFFQNDFGEYGQEYESLLNSEAKVTLNLLLQVYDRDGRVKGTEALLVASGTTWSVLISLLSCGPQHS